MNKQTYIDKLAIITDELQQITSNWLKNDYAITELDVENYLSNIRYLSEQAAILKKFLIASETELTVTSAKTISTESISTETFSAENSSVENTRAETIEEKIIEEKIIEENITPKKESLHMDMADVEISLHQKLSSQIKENTLADSLKHNYFHRDLNFSLNDKFFIIQQLFNGDEKDFNKVMAHLATLDSWEEVELYLSATCMLPYEWESKPDQLQKFFDLLIPRFNG